MKNKIYNKTPYCILTAILMLLPLSVRASADDDSEKGGLIMQTGVSLMQQKKYSAAADKFLHLLEFGHLYGSDFAKSQRSFLIGYIKWTVKACPDCRRRVLKTYGNLLRKARDFTIHPNEMGVLAETGTLLSAENELIATYDAMLEARPGHAMLASMTDEIFNLLYDSRRYETIVCYLDLVQRAEKEMDTYNGLEGGMLRSYAKDGLIHQFLKYVAIYTSLGRKENSNRIKMMIDRLTGISK